MLKNFYRSISINRLIPVNKNILEKTIRKILETRFKIVNHESYNMLTVFTPGGDICEASNIIVLNLNIYSLFSKYFALDNWSIKILANASKILNQIYTKNFSSLAFIITANPFTLTAYFDKENIRLNKDTCILHIAPTGLYFSLFQKKIAYFLLEHNNGFVNKSTVNKILEKIINVNIQLNKSNNYLTENVINEEVYDVFTIGGSLLKTYIIEEKNDPSLKPVLISLETPPFINIPLIINGIREFFDKIGVILTDFLDFNSVHIQPFNDLHRILERAYTEIMNEQPYIDWFTMPSTVEVFNKFFNVKNQLLFGPGVVTRPIREEVFENQLSIFTKVVSNLLKIKGGV